MIPFSSPPPRPSGHARNKWPTVTIQHRLPSITVTSSSSSPLFTLEPRNEQKLARKYFNLNQISKNFKEIEMPAFHHAPVTSRESIKDKTKMKTRPADGADRDGDVFVHVPVNTIFFFTRDLRSVREPWFGTIDYAGEREPRENRSRGFFFYSSAD